MTRLDESGQLEYIVSLQRQLQDYKYGVVKNGRLQGMKSAEEWNKYYRYMSPKEFERYHGGACWDYVAYQTEKLMKKGIKFNNYYLEFLDDPDRGTHTITVCVVGRNYVYMESSFKSIAGVYISDHLDDILDFVLTEMHKLKKDTFSKRHTIRRYMYMMQYGCDCETFMNWMYSNEVVREDSPTFKETSIGNRIIKKDTEPYYRVTYKGIGIYEAFKQLVPERVWIQFLKSKYATWLPKPPDYTSGYESYFTKLGFSKFEDVTLPYMSKFLDRKKINIKKYMDIGDIVYRDMFQVIVSTSYSESTNQPKYYFVSVTNMNDKLLQPRIPDNFLTQIGAEDNKTPRVCFSDSIDGCLIALSRNLKGMKLFVHVADCDESVLRQFRHPTTEEVPDANITDEVWSLKPVEIKCIGQIQVKKAYPKPLPYKYTDRDGTQKTAELYSWDWSWIYRFDEDSIYNESEHKSEPLSNFKTRKCDKNLKFIDSHDPNVIKYLMQDTYIKKHIDHFNKFQDGEIIIDVDRDVIIGRIFVWNKTDKKNTGLINSLIIDKDYRGYGLSNKLIKDAIHKYGGYDLLVYKDNKVAINLYKKHGFIIDYKGSHKDTYHMILKSHMKDKTFTESSNTNISFSKSSSDIHSIINTLSNIEKEYIGNGYFVDSKYVVYREVLKIDNIPAAFIDAYTTRGMKKDECFVVLAVSANEKFRHKGYGTFLTKRMIEKLKKDRKIRKIIWEFDNGNKNSEDMANKLKFEGDGNKRTMTLYEKVFTESYVMNEKDIYYNKDKFDSGEINLCFITGHSGSGKSTMGKSMKSDDTEYCDLDTVVDIWYMYLSHDNLSQYGPLIYSFFTGKGKKYLHNSKEELTKDPYSDISNENFGTGIIQDFIKHVKSYAKRHTDKKFVIDGVWLYSCIKPNELDDCAVYIKGTSVTISRIRAAKRDSQNAGNKIDIMKSFIKNISNISRWKYFIIDEKMIKSWRNHFSKLEKDKPVTESTIKSDIDENFKKKESIKLSSLKKVKITQQLCNKLSSKYSHLKHLRIAPNTLGFFFMKSDDEIVVTIMVETKKNNEKWIQALEVSDEYKGHNLGNQILNFAVTQMNARFLSVRKDNKVAFNMYRKYGFKIYNETDSMYFMKLNKR